VSCIGVKPLDNTIQKFADAPGTSIATVPIRRTGFMEYARAGHSALMLAARITLPHFSVSSAMSLAKSVGKPGSAVAPKSSLMLAARITLPHLLRKKRRKLRGPR